MLTSNGPFGSSPPVTGQKEDHKIWDYQPSLPAAATAAVVCSILTILHTYRTARSRTSFCIPFVIGGVLETTGYAARAAAHHNIESLTLYIAQSLLILLAPIFFAASIYAVLGRFVLQLDGADLSIVHPSIMTKFFVFSDVLCFFIQGTGGGILAQARTQGAIDLGNNVVLFGLIVQMYIFGFFVRVAISFHREMARSSSMEARNKKFRWRRSFAFLHIACACMGVRNIYRIVEYALGKNGYLWVNEWPLYIGDFAMMAAMLTVCLVYDQDMISKKKPSERP